MVPVFPAGTCRHHRGTITAVPTFLPAPLYPPFAYSDFKYLPSEIKRRTLNVLHGVLRRATPLLRGDGAEYVEGGGLRRNTDGSRPGASGQEAQQQPQGQAELSLRNAFKMAVYLLFSAAFPSEECYSSAKQVGAVGLRRVLLCFALCSALCSLVWALCSIICSVLCVALRCVLRCPSLCSALCCSVLPCPALLCSAISTSTRGERPLDSAQCHVSAQIRLAISIANTKIPALRCLELY